MTIPNLDNIIYPTLFSLNDNNIHNLSDIDEFCAKSLNVSEKDRQERLPRGAKKFRNRIQWCIYYLKKNGLLEQPARGLYKITLKGNETVSSGKQHFNNYYLDEIKKSSSTPKDKQSTKKNRDSEESLSSAYDKMTPIEKIEDGFKELAEKLTDELTNKILEISPYGFEELIVKLLLKMGYGSPEHNRNAVTSKSRDGGIDGIVRADRFGFDNIYVQAKKWNPDTAIPRPEIQKFAGAIGIINGTAKGLFITTGHFSDDAKEFARNYKNNKIVLVDGKELIRLMIEYNLGVSTETVYEIKRIDNDFFDMD